MNRFSFVLMIGKLHSTRDRIKRNMRGTAGMPVNRSEQ